MLVCIILDTSASLNQSTYCGQSLFDLCKCVCISIIKQATKGDQFIIFTNRTKSCPKYLEGESAIKYVNNLQAVDVSNFSNLINNSLNAVSALIMSMNCDTFEYGRDYQKSFPTQFIIITSYSNITVPLKIYIKPSSEYLVSPIRWDQMIYSFLLYFPAIKVDLPTPAINSASDLYKLCSQTNGSITLISTFPQIFDSVSKVYQKKPVPRLSLCNENKIQETFSLLSLKRCGPALSNYIPLTNSIQEYILPFPEGGERRQIYPLLLFDDSITNDNKIPFYLERLKTLDLPYSIYTIEDEDSILLKKKQSLFLYSSSIPVGIYTYPKQIYILPPDFMNLIDILSSTSTYIYRKNDLINKLSQYLRSIPREYYDIMARYFKEKNYQITSTRPYFHTPKPCVFLQVEYPTCPSLVSIDTNSKKKIKLLSTKKEPCAKNIRCLHDGSHVISKTDLEHTISIHKMSDFGAYLRGHSPLRDPTTETGERIVEVAAMIYKPWKGRNKKGLSHQPIDEADDTLLQPQAHISEKTLQKTNKQNDIINPSSSQLYDIYISIYEQMMNYPRDIDLDKLLNVQPISIQEKQYLFYILNQKTQSFQFSYHSMLQDIPINANQVTNNNTLQNNTSSK
ncbi:hypothetical protein WA158_003426 [Blastocystis sp. Blastoise]